MNKSISVVIPNYNGEKIIGDAIESAYKALKFVTSDYEVIVPDDCSSDNSVSFIKSQYPEVIVVESQKNGGFAVNVNKGLK
jgi:glycosyltransferase involved in cell wall biosynthesis